MPDGLKFGMNIADSADQYMDAPAVSGILQSPFNNPIASILDMLGINKQVANQAPKSEDNALPATSTPSHSPTRTTSPFEQDVNGLFNGISKMFIS